MSSTNRRGPIMTQRYWPVDQTPRCETGGCIVPTRDGDHIAFTSDRNPHGQLRGYATVAEVAQMIDEIKAGKWDHLAAGDE